MDKWHQSMGAVQAIRATSAFTSSYNWRQSPVLTDWPRTLRKARTQASELAKEGEWRQAADVIHRAKKRREALLARLDAAEREREEAECEELRRKLDNKYRKTAEWWDQRIAENAEAAEREVQETKERHRVELEELEKEVQAEVASAKDSTTVLELTRRVHMFAQLEDFTSAQHSELDLLQRRKEEEVASNDTLVERTQLKRNRMLFIHMRELNRLEGELKYRAKELRQLRAAELQRLETQANFYEAHLREQQQYMRLRTKVKLPSSKSLPTISSPVLRLPDVPPPPPVSSAKPGRRLGDDPGAPLELGDESTKVFTIGLPDNYSTVYDKPNPLPVVRQTTRSKPWW